MEEKQFYHYMQYFDRDFLLKSKQHAFYLDSLSRCLERSFPRKWCFLPLPLQNGGVLSLPLFFFQNKIFDRYIQVTVRFGDLLWLFLFACLFLKMRAKGARREKSGIFLSSDLELCLLPILCLIILEEPKQLARKMCILTQFRQRLLQAPSWEAFSFLHWILIQGKVRPSYNQGCHESSWMGKNFSLIIFCEVFRCLVWYEWNCFIVLLASNLLGLKPETNKASFSLRSSPVFFQP